jgi:hypothetical protein
MRKSAYRCRTVLPSGLPYFRIGKAGKLTFYRNQIVRWILEKQQQIPLRGPSILPSKAADRCLPATTPLVRSRVCRVA